MLEFFLNQYTPGISMLGSFKKPIFNNSKIKKMSRPVGSTNKKTAKKSGNKAGKRSYTKRAVMAPPFLELGQLVKVEKLLKTLGVSSCELYFTNGGSLKARIS